jgi:hypothetical protein
VAGVLIVRGKVIRLIWEVAVLRKACTVLVAAVGLAAVGVGLAGGTAAAATGTCGAHKAVVSALMSGTAQTGVLGEGFQLCHVSGDVVVSDDGATLQRQDPAGAWVTVATSTTTAVYHCVTSAATTYRVASPFVSSAPSVQPCG